MTEEVNVRRVAGRFLCKSGRSRGGDGGNHPRPQELLISNVSLSFWGGIDPLTGIVIDTTHPLHGRCVRDKVLCLPSGRGSCTASQVLLELILNGLAPSAIVLRDVDGLVTVGALVADEIFEKDGDMDIMCVGRQGFELLLQRGKGEGFVNGNGELIVGSRDELLQVLGEENMSLSIRSRMDTNCQYDDESRQFTSEELAMLEKCETQAERMALRVIFRYAHVVMNPTATPTKTITKYRAIQSAHIDGCTYIGPGGLQFVRRLVEAQGRAKVPTTLNSVSADRQQWKNLGVPTEYAHNSLALGDAYLELQCQPSFTCAPYLLKSANAADKLGQDLCWGESNAVVYANTVWGARTEKYADYLDICCAIAGIVPQTGVHLEENRIPAIILDARPLIQELSVDRGGDDAVDFWDGLFPVLGHLCGSISDGKVPLLIGLEPWAEEIKPEDHLKAFCAAFGTTGTSPLIHIAGITPEARNQTTIQAWIRRIETTVPISLDQVQETFSVLDKDRTSNNEVALIALGNPHLSLAECRRLVELVDRPSNEHCKRKHDDVRIMACMSRELFQQANDQGYIQKLKDFGMEFIHDTCWCMLLDPPIIPTVPGKATLTNSGKYAHYGPGLTHRPFRFASTADCITAAVTGRVPPPMGSGRWLSSSFSKQRATPKNTSRRYYHSATFTSVTFRNQLPRALARVLRKLR